MNFKIYVYISWKIQILTITGQNHPNFFLNLKKLLFAF